MRMIRMFAMPAILLVCAILLGVAGQPEANCEANEATKLTASDARLVDYFFGFSCSLSNDVAVIGMPSFNLGDGTAYIHRFGGCDVMLEAKLTASDAAFADAFGTAVSICGDVVLIGARHDDDAASDAGSAYVFRFDGDHWSEEAELMASDAAVGDEFGWSVSLDRDVAVVGAPFDDHFSVNTGSAYVFRFDGKEWVEEAKLSAFDSFGQDRFGTSVSVSGNVAVIGSYGDSDAGVRSGSAYIFRYDGSNWNHETKLTASDAREEAWFGFSVSLSGAVAVIGAYQFDNLCPGSAYVYRYDGVNWNEEQQLTASDGELGDRFGISVAISEHAIAVGATGDQGSGAESGSAYVFRLDDGTWREDVKLIASDGEAYDYFGHAVAVNAGRVLVGSVGDDDLQPQSGAVYAYDNVSDCNENGVVDLCDIAAGLGTDANGNGTLDECECIWDLSGDGVVNFVDVVLLVLSLGPCTGCSADLDCDGLVGVLDLLALIENFGPCPGSECVWDVNDDGVVNLADLLAVIMNLGLCDDPDDCPWDIDGDGIVDGSDVVAVATHFGACD